MKYVCLGYVETNKFDEMSESERNTIIDECLAYDDVLRKNGHFAGGEPLLNKELPKRFGSRPRQRHPFSFSYMLIER